MEINCVLRTHKKIIDKINDIMLRTLKQYKFYFKLYIYFF